MIKVALFRGNDTAYGQTVFPLFSKYGDRSFEKTAAPTTLPAVSSYIANLRPRPDAQYVLVNALGAGEYYGSNINADHFPEAALIHCPDRWSGDPTIDRGLAAEWPYGFPTFYKAHAFAHHRNKDTARAYGDVELTTWNPQMKRVELVVRVDKDKCDRFGGTAVWDKLKLGQYLDVSMGAKVPFDTCSLCLDWDTYRKAQATFNPARHRFVGAAVLEYHKRLKAENGTGIRGLSITREDYCPHMKKMPNRILPDGRKVFVYNDYPRFFDISFVFIGADKTAKVMWKVASESRVWSLPGAELAEKLGYVEAAEPEMQKAASVDTDVLKLAFLGKAAKAKGAEIEKHGPPSFDAKAVPLLTEREPHMPPALLDAISQFPLSSIFSSAASLGIPFRPREFQRILIVKMGLRPMADSLEEKGIVFPHVPEAQETPFGDTDVLAPIQRMLGSLFDERSALSPAIDKRITLLVCTRGGKGTENPSSLPTNLLNKIGSAYSGYRKGLMDYWVQDRQMHLAKAASALSPESFLYLKNAYWNEVGKL